MRGQQKHFLNHGSNQEQLLFLTVGNLMKGWAKEVMVTINNHLLEFVDSETGTYINTIEVTWHHFKACLPEYNRLGRFEGYITW
ncbi:hypothetical protein TNCT_603571 [Trichonephila clavata]|uniref:Uncharacterized protein n=1 Tax=Trichonephila clavata TaxID=2740835 RepID=A0A8X6F5B5_TRICU|nr:hypothetical protein TNCT_603571 [Trichonephila clavata]